MMSRRQAEDWIINQKITLNGASIKLGTKFNPLKDKLYIKNTLVTCHNKSNKYNKNINNKNKLNEFNYFVLYKPRGYLVSKRSQGNKSTIFTLKTLQSTLKSHNIHHLNYVGRLDFHSEGLLVLTEDGDFTYKLTHPKFKQKKVYLVKLNKIITDLDFKKLQNPIKINNDLIDNYKIKKATHQTLKLRSLQLFNINDKDFKKNAKTIEINNWYEITIYLGKKHIIRKIFKSFGYDVLRLIRVQMSGIKLDHEINPGQIKKLDKKIRLTADKN